MTEIWRWVRAAAIAHAPEKTAQQLADLWVPQMQASGLPQWDYLGGRCPTDIAGLDERWVIHLARHASDPKAIRRLIDSGVETVRAVTCHNPNLDADLTVYLWEEYHKAGGNHHALADAGFLPSQREGFDSKEERSRIVIALRTAAIRNDVVLGGDVPYSAWLATGDGGPIGPNLSEWIATQIPVDQFAGQRVTYHLRLQEPWRSHLWRRIEEAGHEGASKKQTILSALTQMPMWPHLNLDLVLDHTTPNDSDGSFLLIRQLVWREIGVDPDHPLPKEKVPEALQQIAKLPEGRTRLRLETLCDLVDGKHIGDTYPEDVATGDVQAQSDWLGQWIPEYGTLSRRQVEGVDPEVLVAVLQTHPNYYEVVHSLGGPYPVLELAERWGLPPKQRLRLINVLGSDPAALIDLGRRLGLKPTDLPPLYTTRDPAAKNTYRVPGRAGDEWADWIVFGQTLAWNPQRGGSDLDQLHRRFLAIEPKRTFQWLDGLTRDDLVDTVANEAIHRWVGEWLADWFGDDTDNYVDFDSLFGQWEQRLGDLCSLISKKSRD